METTMRHHYTHLEGPSEKGDNTFCAGKDVCQLELSLIASESVKCYDHFTKGLTSSY